MEIGRRKPLEFFGDNKGLIFSMLGVSCVAGAATLSSQQTPEPSSIVVSIECPGSTLPTTPNGNPYDGITGLTCADGFERYIQPINVISEQTTSNKSIIVGSYVISCIDPEIGVVVTPLVADNLSADDPTRYSVFCPWENSASGNEPPMSPSFVSIRN